MANSTTRQMADKAKESAAQFGEKAGAMLHGAHDAAAEVSHRAQESLAAVKESASGYIEEGREKVQSLGRTVERQVRRWPLSALLVAAGFGFLLGVLLVRR